MPANPTITQEGFQLLLDWLGTSSEPAAEKYEKIRGRLIRIFVGRGCHEAEHLADQTIDRVILKIPQIRGEYVGDPAAYFYGVAHYIHREWLRSQRPEVELTVIAAAAPVDEEGPEYSCLETCLEKLPAASREMIVEYYRDERRAKIERRKTLANRLGISIGALQIKASRVRAKLAKCVRECVTQA
jgi:DNA-directed RNA polymerase specialized sigma24 family protein